MDEAEDCDSDSDSDGDLKQEVDEIMTNIFGCYAHMLSSSAQKLLVILTVPSLTLILM